MLNNRNNKQLYLFINIPNKSLYCPICNKVYEEPLLSDCGHTFCKLCILNNNDKCPIDNNICKLKLINRNIAEQIDDLQIRCMYGVKLNHDKNNNENYDNNLPVIDPDGCDKIINYGKRNEHESSCEYRILKCPNSISCLPVRYKDLEEHLKTCSNIKCPNSKYKCTFFGHKNAVEEHIKTCKYESVKEILEYYDDKINQYEETIQDLHQSAIKKDEQIQILTNYISTLSLRMDNFENKVEDKFRILDDNQQALINEINKEYKRLGEEMNYIKLKINETKMKSLDMNPERGETQTTVKCLGTYVGHLGSVTCLVCYNDLLISGSLDDLIKIWDTTSKYSCIKTMQANTGGISLMTIKDNILYTVGVKEIKIISWNLDTYEKIDELSCNEEINSIIAVENKIIIGSMETIKIYDSKTFDLIREIKEEEGSLVYALESYGKIFYHGSLKALKARDLVSFNVIYKVALPGRVIYSIVLYNRYVLVANDNSIYVLDSKTYQLLSTLNGHRAAIIDLVVAQSHLGDKLFSASKDQTLRVWSLEFLICSQILHRHEGSLTSLSSIQNRVFSGSTDRQIKVWQINAFGRT